VENPGAIFLRDTGEYPGVEFFLRLSDLFDKTRRCGLQEDALRAPVGCIAAATNPTALFQLVDKLSNRGFAQAQLLGNLGLNHAVAGRQAGDDQTLVL
jgi:hypothetical protein